MKRYLYSLLFVLVSCTVGFSQAPPQFNYQAVARDANSAFIDTKDIGVRISILENGNPVYSETQTTKTNKYGLFNLQIGGKTGFENVNWGGAAKEIKIDIDPAGGTNYTSIGQAKLLSVPYALYSNASPNAASNTITGSGAPLINLGKLGDYYIDNSTTNPTIYGPRTATSWGVGKVIGTTTGVASKTKYNAGTGIKIDTSSTNTVTISNRLDSTKYLKDIDQVLGDVSGTYKTLSVDKIKGKIVDTTGLGKDKILIYDGIKWVLTDKPVAGGSLVKGKGIEIANGIISNIGDTDSTNDVLINTQFGGDVSGTYDNLTIKDGAVTDAKIDSVSASKITKAGAADKQVLTFTNGKWEAKDLPVSAGTIIPGRNIEQNGTKLDLAQTLDSVTQITNTEDFYINNGTNPRLIIAKDKSTELRGNTLDLMDEAGSVKFLKGDKTSGKTTLGNDSTSIILNGYNPTTSNKLLYVRPGGQVGDTTFPTGSATSPPIITGAGLSVNNVNNKITLRLSPSLDTVGGFLRVKRIINLDSLIGTANENNILKVQGGKLKLVPDSAKRYTSKTLTISNTADTIGLADATLPFSKLAPIPGITSGQIIKWNGTAYDTLTLPAGAGTDSQTLTYIPTGKKLKISNGNTIDLPIDTSSSNELQTLSLLNGDSLVISNGGAGVKLPVGTGKTYITSSTISVGATLDTMGVKDGSITKSKLAANAVDSTKIGGISLDNIQTKAKDGQVLKFKGGKWIAVDTTKGGSSQWDDVTGGINYAKGKVGIGTTDPATDMQINGLNKSSLLLSGNLPRLYLADGVNDPLTKTVIGLDFNLNAFRVFKEPGMKKPLGKVLFNVDTLGLVNVTGGLNALGKISFPNVRKGTVNQFLAIDTLTGNVSAVDLPSGSAKTLQGRSGIKTSSDANFNYIDADTSSAIWSAARIGLNPVDKTTLLNSTMDINKVLTWNGTKWVASTSSGSGKTYNQSNTIAVDNSTGADTISVKDGSITKSKLAAGAVDSTNVGSLALSNLKTTAKDGQVLKFKGNKWVAADTSTATGTSQWKDVTGGINYANGNVGIGVTNPKAPLHINSQGKKGGLVVYDTTSTAQSSVSKGTSRIYIGDGWKDPYSNEVIGLDFHANYRAFRIFAEQSIGSTGKEMFIVGTDGKVTVFDSLYLRLAQRTDPTLKMVVIRKSGALDFVPMPNGASSSYQGKSGINVDNTNFTISAKNDSAMWNANKIYGHKIDTAVIDKVGVTSAFLKYDKGSKTFVLDTLKPSSLSNAWDLTGNTGTTPATNFIGTLDDQPLVFKTNGIERLKIGGSTKPDYALEVTSRNEFTKALVGITNYEGFESGIDLIRRNGTFTAPTAIKSGNNLGKIRFMGETGSGIQEGANITAIAAENWTTGKSGTGLIFNVTDIGSGAYDNAIFIHPNSNVGIGTVFDLGTKPQQQLDINGGIRIGNTITALKGSIRFGINDKFQGHDGTGWKDFVMGTGTSTTYLKGTGIKIAGNLINADSAKAIWDAGSIGNNPVDTTQALTPANKGQVLKWNGTKWAAGNDSSIYASGGGIKYKIKKGLNLLPDSTLEADISNAIWNASKILGKPVSGKFLNGGYLKLNSTADSVVFAPAPSGTSQWTTYTGPGLSTNGGIEYTGEVYINDTLDVLNIIKTTQIRTTSLNASQDINGDKVSVKTKLVSEDSIVTRALRIKEGAAAGYILQSDALGKTKWVSPSTLGTNTGASPKFDNTTVDTLTGANAGLIGVVKNSLDSTYISDGKIGYSDLSIAGASINQVLTYTTNGWKPSSGSVASGWALTGNVPTTLTSATNYLGTQAGTGATSLRIRTAGTERMVIDSNGRVGIGVQTVTRAQFEQHGKVGNTNAIFGGDGNGVSIVSSTASTGIGFNQYSNSGFRAISTGFSGSISLDLSKGDMNFGTAASVATNQPATSNTPKMTLSNAGQLGIGVVVPLSKLHLNGGTIRIDSMISAVTQMVVALPNGVLATQALPTGSGGTYTKGAGVYINSLNVISASPDGATLDTLATSGKLQVRLHSLDSTRIAKRSIELIGLAGSGAATNQVPQWNGTTWVPATISNTSLSQGSDIRISAGRVNLDRIIDSTLAINAPAGKNFRIDGTSSQKLLLDSSGIGIRVGIGTSNTTLTKKLTIGATNADSNSIQMRGYGIGGAKLLYVDAFGIVKDTNFTSSSSSPWTRNAATSTIAPTNITDSVGIGTASPTARLHVRGSSAGQVVSLVENTNIAGVAGIRTLANGVGMAMFSVGNAGFGGFGTISNHGLQIIVNNSDAIRILPNRNIGIKNTNPSRLFTVGQGLVDSNSVRLVGYGNTSSQLLYVDATGVVRDTSFSAISGASNAWNLTGNNVPIIALDTVSQFLGSTNNHPLIFKTSGNEQMRISRAGNVNINKNLNVGGLLTSSNITEKSDARYKTNVATIGNALATVQQLRGVSYDWKRNEFPELNFKQGKDLGLIAQEVEKVLPELVNTDEKGFKSVQYSHLVSVLVEAIKEQQNQIETLKAEVSDKDNKVQNSENRIKTLESSVSTLSSQMQLLLEIVGKTEGVKASK